MQKSRKWKETKRTITGKKSISLEEDSNGYYFRYDKIVQKCGRFSNGLN